MSVLSLIWTNLAQCTRIIKHVFEIGCIGVSRPGSTVTSRKPGRISGTELVGGPSYRSQQFDHMFYRSNVWAI
ncbi:hypothetical protein C1S80_11660 [Mycolicibacterium aubagnense]|nr:hypothetical protein C1S80_11660 [Mycolicibacterium aubagnense]